MVDVGVGEGLALERMLPAGPPGDRPGVPVRQGPGRRRAAARARGGDGRRRHAAVPDRQRRPRDVHRGARAPAARTQPAVAELARITPRAAASSRCRGSRGSASATSAGARTSSGWGNDPEHVNFFSPGRLQKAFGSRVRRGPGGEGLPVVDRGGEAARGAEAPPASRRPERRPLRWRVACWTAGKPLSPFRNRSDRLIIDGKPLADDHFSGVGHYAMSLVGALDEVLVDRPELDVRIVVPATGPLVSSSWACGASARCACPCPTWPSGGRSSRGRSRRWTGCSAAARTSSRTTSAGRSTAAHRSPPCTTSRSRRCPRPSTARTRRCCDARCATASSTRTRSPRSPRRWPTRSPSTTTCPAGRIHVVGAAADQRHFYRRSDREIAEVKATYGIYGDYLITVGNIEPRKNQIRLIDAFCSLPRCARRSLHARPRRCRGLERARHPCPGRRGTRLRAQGHGAPVDRVGPRPPGALQRGHRLHVHEHLRGVRHAPVGGDGLPDAGARPVTGRRCRKWPAARRSSST